MKTPDEAAPFAEGIGELFLASHDLGLLAERLCSEALPAHPQREALLAWCQAVLFERNHVPVSPRVAAEALQVDWAGGEARAYLQNLLDLELGPELDEAVGRLHMLALYRHEQATRFVGDPPSVEDDPDVA